jgi:hypothetical protein
MDYYYADTGEIRKPKKDEWFKNSDEELIICRHDNFPFEREIYVRHEIEMPEGVVRAKIWVYDSHEIPVKNVHIGLPRPKVKRWIWMYETTWFGRKVLMRTPIPLSEKELSDWVKTYRNGWHKVPNTEVEK